MSLRNCSKSLMRVGGQFLSVSTNVGRVAISRNNLLINATAASISTTARRFNHHARKEGEYYSSSSSDTSDSDDDLPHHGSGVIPRPTDAAPHFAGKAVVNGQFKDITLRDYKGKWLLLFFYPLDFTFVCPTEIVAFSDASEEFRKINCDVVGCSTDSHFSHLAWINTPRKDGGLGEMKIPLLSDFKKEIAFNYGILEEDVGVAFRGVFLIDPEGKIAHCSVNDLPVGRSVDECLRLVKAFQFVKEHGEVCPANWKPESPTIKPNPVESKEYFKKVNK